MKESRRFAYLLIYLKYVYNFDTDAHGLTVTHLQIIVTFSEIFGLVEVRR